MLAKIKQFFIPPQFPDDDEKARVANLLNTLSWMIFVVFIILTTAFHILENDLSVTIINAAVAFVNLIPLALLRRHHVRAASWVTIIMFYLGITAAAYLIAGLTMGIASAYMLLILLAGLLAGRPAANSLLVITIILGGGLLYLENSGQMIPTGSVQTDGLSAGAIALLLAVTLNLTLRDLMRASSRMRQSNEELQAIRANLEIVVADRTQALELAADVSRNISQVRETDLLLQDTVDVIQERFNLYYAQIYLANKNQTRLSLKAGTGRIGAQLVQRDHGLPFGMGSINGIAAAEKRTVVVADTAVSPLFKANPLLPDTCSEMAVPLLVGDTVVGVLNLQSNIVNGLGNENLSAFEMLAGQIAIAVENASLFAETAQARAEVEQNLQFMTRQGWDSYQDGITQAETVGFTYEEDAIHPLTDAAPPASGKDELQVPITVANELIGYIQLEAEDSRPWSAEAKELATIVAQQVGQQAENLRLLAETDRYRNEAEQAVRRFRREAWQDYLDDQVKLGSFIYDQQQVKSVDNAGQAVRDMVGDNTIRQPLAVQGEPFGEILLDGVDSPEAQSLATAVAEQLSNHLENIRLSNQTEKALNETAEQARRLAILNEIGHDLSAANSTEEIFAALSQHMKSIIPHDHITLILLKAGGQTADVLAIVEGQAVVLLANQPVTGTVVEKIIEQRQLLYLADVREYDYPDTHAMVEKGVLSAIIAPLVTARGVLGIIDLESSKVDDFAVQDQSLLQQIASSVASTLESQQLFAEAQKQAEKERLVNIVSQKIQSTVTIEGALETAVAELGKALSTRYTQVELSLATNENNKSKAHYADIDA